MKTIFKLAWRNIWRNKRRTYITMASIFFAVLFSSFMVAFQKGGWDRMIDNVVGYYFGYAQVHQDGYWDEQSIDKAFAIPTKLTEISAEMPAMGLVPRVESFALASHGNTTGEIVENGVLATGDSLATLRPHAESEWYMKPDNDAMFIAEEVAQNMKLDIGDTLVLVTQTYREANANGIYPLVQVESFSLIARTNNTTGVMVVGTDPEAEDALTNLSSRLTDGRYLKPGEQATLIAEGIAKNMKLQVGDTLVLISQGYHGVNAAGKYPIVGIVDFPSPDLNKRMVYLPLEVAQYFYGAENLVTTVALNLEDKDAVPPAIKSLKNQLSPEEYEVMDWKELMPDLIKAKEADAAGAYIMLFVLYVIIAFGIYGTILMMTKEREYEFGVLISIGMKRLKLGISIWVEIIILGFLGSVVGILGAIPLVYYFHINPLDFSKMSEEMTGVYEKWGFDPIFPTSMDPVVFTAQALVVFLITSVLAFYPLLKIMRLKPVEAMRA